MTKNPLNQNGKYVQDLVNTVEPDFIFSDKPINRFKFFKSNKNEINQEKAALLNKLKLQINSIEDCNLKENSKNLNMGNGDINSSIMLIGEAPGKIEDDTGHSFQGEVGSLLKKMLSAININLNKVYRTYSVNFRPPEDRKPTANEIKRYSVFLKDHITIINPKILILMGSTAMESLFGSKIKISKERGNWKDVIINNKSYLTMITFHPAYLLRQPEQKKYSWTDLKEIRKKIDELEINL